MKLSFSTKGWHGRSFEEFCDVAEDLKFEGIELHNIYNAMFTDRDGAFHGYASAATLRRLYEKKLTVVCMDTVCDLGKAENGECDMQEILSCMEIASNLHIPFIRLKASDAGSEEKNAAAIERIAGLLETLLPVAEEKGITLLIETFGLFCRAETLRTLLERFACDSLGALWNLSAAYFGGGESAEQVIKHLGAYVRHVHVSDARMTADGLEYCLVGEGELPLASMMLALRSVNYDGFLSLVWDPRWCEELDDMEIIFSQFVNYMKQYSDTSRKEPALYYNKTHTGKYVWKKEALIDATFSQ
ncbi:MAG: sugar phosphate isomerase/epimerase, partial [Clostridia bacterium]|nr:sugar phosphate isomerase/epimerase [Clostridia bacterium]